MLSDLNTSVHVTGDIFFLQEREGGGDFSMPEACRADLTWNVNDIFLLFSQAPASSYPLPPLSSAQATLGRILVRAVPRRWRW